MALRTYLAALVLVVVAPAPPAQAAQARASAYDSDHARWVAASMKEMHTIRPGMTRADLLKVFMEEGGISSRTWRRYVYRRCGYIKVDVEFAPAGNPSSLEQNPNDRITKISEPFLQWPIMD